MSTPEQPPADARMHRAFGIAAPAPIIEEISASADALRKALIASGELTERLAVILDTAQPFWTTETLQRDFEVQGFAAPVVVVRRRSDNARGTLFFTHNPRAYFDFEVLS